MKFPPEMVDFIEKRTDDMKRIEKRELDQKLYDLHKRDARDEQNKELRERSGSVSSTDPVVSFLYDLIRDHLPIGTVESIVRECPAVETHFTNGYLANYCIDLAKRLRYDDHTMDDTE